MDKKFLIVLFATIFYNGVIGASVGTVQISETKPPEDRHVTDHSIPNAEVSSAPVAEHSTPSPQEASPSPHIQVPKLKNETAHANPKNDSAVHPAAAVVTNKDVPNKNVTDEAKNKTTTVAVDGKNTTKTADGQAAGDKNATRPVVANNTRTTAPGVEPSGKSFTEMPIPISGGPTTTVSPPAPKVPANNGTISNKTDNAVVPSNSSTVKPTTVSTVAPTATTTTVKDNVVIEHTVPTSAQEKHFDGPSFIGGIVLTIGLTAIGFIAFKYYKSGRIDMNYRTL